MELSDLNCKESEDMMRFSRQHSFRSGMLVLIDNTIAYFETLLQVRDMDEEQTGVKVRAAGKS